MTFRDATAAEIDAVMQAAWQAFQLFRQTTLKQRADLMRAIARELEATGDELPRPGSATSVPGPNSS